MSFTGTVSVTNGGSFGVPVPYLVGKKVESAALAASLGFSVDNLKVWTGSITTTTTHALDALTQLDEDGDTIGSAINFLVVYAVWVKNVSTNSATLATVGNAAATQFFGNGGLASATSVVSLTQGDGRWIHVNRSGTSTTGAEDLKVTLSAAGRYEIVVLGTT